MLQILIKLEIKMVMWLQKTVNQAFFTYFGKQAKVH